MARMQNLMDDGLCYCKGKRESGKLIPYVDRSNKIIGTLCTECGVESLVQEYIVDTTDTTSGSLYPRKPSVLKQNLAFQLQCTNTKVDRCHFAYILKPGDHVTWRKYFLYWHHGIVSEIIAKENTIVLISWNKDEDNIVKIMHSHVKVNNEPIFRKEYPEYIKKENSTELVLARARSRICDIEYKFFSNNCEAFATFCKCSVMKSHQIAWMIEKIKEIVGHYIVVCIKSPLKRVLQYSLSTTSEEPGVAGKVVPAEMIERVCDKRNQLDRRWNSDRH
ncbi:hypothetical protein KP79_PYT26093 [Mizuhopecten yessoensis]|uniref:LRAT domain-containing protein n=1 Tax=Mizuhopecten yessoensis TaxID=6573 RepID=A0A210PFF5_MIZYE|nr:hypothetical protein KP79_PYT26093 [Mizuhopecten yessoensis]